ncbi:PrpR N-terminal domain-containing protein [Acidaminococcus sp. NSJ-142]|jgi:hypothetical protein|uniref:sigma-54-dependent Fis family transcriptional regulator n=1 Tax=Acidaminococcus TaxID=904 RepID=UPI001314EE79|nr:MULTISPECIES: sigma-54-dependent Fis family transcriptional regulator [Acidaminococcus]MCD2436489.1 PrpR N-terminal domain-containing protein [Acidaminococcus hominis]MCH4096496.1 PrpR N-terminal domain-containing protein [Acidaminococcus provencensis]
MNHKIQLLAIAPYEALKHVILETAKEFPQLQVTVEVGTIYEGVEKLKQHHLENYDAVLSRGGTKMEVEKNTTLPVFGIPISYYDLLHIIKLVEHYQGKAAILSYENIANSARVLCDVLQLHFDIYNIDQWHNAAEKVTQLKEMGYTLIIGDAVSVEYAEKLGMQNVLLTSGRESVREALTQVTQVTTYLRRATAENTLFHAGLSRQGVHLLCYDETGELLYDDLPKNLHKLQTFCRRLLPAIRTEGDKTVYRKLPEGFFEIRAQRHHYRNAPYSLFFIQPQRFFTQSGTPPYLTFYEASSGHSEQRGLPNFLQIVSPTAWTQALEMAKSVQPLCITGAPGTEGDIFCQQLYEKSGRTQTPLLQLDCRLLHQEDILHFCTDPHSPLFLEQGSLCFRNLEGLAPELFTLLVDELAAARYSATGRLYFQLTGSPEDPLLQERLTVLRETFRVFHIPLPSLAHKEDKILNYALLYLQHHNHLYDTKLVGMDPEAVTLLCQYSWPQNTSQLRQVLRRAIVLSTETPWIRAHTIRQLLRHEEEIFRPSLRQPLPLHQTLDQLIQAVVQKTLEEENMNQSAAARRLGISRTTLWRLLKKKKE